MTIVNHDLRAVNSGTITLVPSPNFTSLEIPDLDRPDSTQKYDIGTKFEFNGKVYFYGYTTSIVTSRKGALVSYPQAMAQRVTADADLYATSIVVTTVSPDGPSADGTFPVDYLKGGHVVVFAESGGATDFTRGIISNTVVAVAGVMTIGLDSPLPVELVTGTSVTEAIASPFASVCNNLGSLSQPACGVPTCYSAASKWIWLQTWGPCWLAGQTTLGVDGALLASFRADGALDIESAVTANNTTQPAGYVMFNGSTSGSQGAPFVYLQIAR